MTRGCGEMVYTLVLGTSAVRRGGSTPLIRTFWKNDPCGQFFKIGERRSRTAPLHKQLAVQPSKRASLLKAEGRKTAKLA